MTSQFTSPNSSSASATPTLYMFTTKEGTDLSTFEQYIKALPDKGEGRKIVYPNLSWQTYATNLTVEQAKEVATKPFINYIGPVQGYDTGSYGTIPANLPSDFPPPDPRSMKVTYDRAPEGLCSVKLATNDCNRSASQPSFYFFKTVNGTTIDKFEQYIKTLPDKGQGEKFTDPIVPFQSYMTALTAPQAEEVAKQSFVRYIDPVVRFKTDFPGDDWGQEEQHHRCKIATSSSANPTLTMSSTQASSSSSDLQLPGTSS